MNNHQRCGRCKNCKLIESKKRLFVPNPPFSHADDDTVKCWNDLLRDYPCLNPPNFSGCDCA